MILDLPLYEVRSFFRKSKEGNYTIIQTHYTKYVLDDETLPGNYWERRLALRCNEKALPYKLYPLKRRITSLSQLARSKADMYINSKGKLVRHAKERFYNIEVHKVLSSVQVYNGKWQNYIREAPFPFITDSPASHLSVIKARGSYWLFDVHDTEPEERRYRVKL